MSGLSPSGLWCEKRVPHENWQRIGTYRYPEPVLCEMCKRQMVRNVEIMFHPLHPRVLEVGRDCSKAMRRGTGEPKPISPSPRKHSRVATKLPEGWRRSRNGNPCKAVDSYRATVFKNTKTKKWGFFLNDLSTGASLTSLGAFRSPEDAIADVDKYISDWKARAVRAMRGRRIRKRLV
jgi:hypothetical protein